MILRPLKEPIRHLIISAPENWSRHVLLWNLAADPQNEPPTNNGSSPVCAGAITLDAAPDALPHVVSPRKRHVLIVSNTTEQESTFSVRFQGKDATASLPAGAVARYVW
jgi:glucosylceramidase